MPVSTEAVIDAPIETIWNLISDFGGLMRWHPQVVRCEVEGNGLGARRTVFFADWSAVEELVELDSNRHVLSYLVVDSSRPAVIGARGTMSLETVSASATRLTWTLGLPDDAEGAEVVNVGLRSYYPERIKHLKQALGVS